MTQVPSVHRPGPRDEPRPAWLVMLAAACFAVGFLAARASLDEVRTAAAQAGSGPAGAEGLGAPVVLIDAGTPPPPPPPRGLRDGGPPPPPLPVPDPEPLPEAEAPAPSGVEGVSPPAAPGGTGEIVQGRVAYIRCDGAPPAPGPNPCPRDPRVEREVWSAIDRLAVCPGLAGRRGAADVRVVFAGGAVSGLGFRDVGAGALDADAIRACLQPALRDLRSTIPASRMTASFQFDLR